MWRERGGEGVWGGDKMRGRGGDRRSEMERDSGEDK